MNYWPLQLILAARNRDDDGGWIQIIVFAIIMIFYAVGSIISKAKKTTPKGKGKQIPRKPARKVPESTIDLEALKQLWRGESPKARGQPQVPGPSSVKQQTAKPQVRLASRKVIRPRPAVPAESKEAVKLPAFETHPKLEKVHGLTAKVSPAAEKPQTEYLSDILSDYEDPEKLRRVILHYEILGKPISLREPQKQGF